MFTNSILQATGRSVRFVALAAFVAVAAVPTGLAIGLDGTAYAQSSNGGGGGGGGGGGSNGSGGNGPNPVLECLGPDCINVSKAQIPPCTHNYCKPKPKFVKKDSCEIQVCDIVYGEKVCWLERAYDVRICKKERL